MVRPTNVVSTKLSIVDTHTHIIADDSVKYPLRPLTGGSSRGWVSESPVSAEGLIRIHDSAGIAKAVLVQPQSAYGKDNSYVADVAAKHSGRFVGVGLIDQCAPDALDQMDYWVEQRKLVGFRLSRMHNGSQLGPSGSIADPSSYPVWKRAALLDIPLCVHITSDEFDALRLMLERFDQTRVVLDHFGGTSVDDGPPFSNMGDLLSMSSYPNLYVKVTHRTLEALIDHECWSSAFFNILIERFGANRIAWGSNFPAAGMHLNDLIALALNSLDEASLTERSWIMSGTAQSLYPTLID
jgi:L-fuconolactonase